MKSISKKIIALILIVAIFLIGLGKFCSNPESIINRKCIESLDERREKVLSVTGIASIASGIITLLPDDTCSTVASEISDLIGYGFLLIAVLMCEKYLVPLTGFIGIQLLLPLAALIFLYSIIKSREDLKRFASKVAAFGIAIYLVIPFSCITSNFIDRTFESSMNRTLDEAVTLTNELERNTEKDSEESISDLEVKPNASEEKLTITSEETDKKYSGKWFHNTVENVGTAIGNVGSKVGNAFDKIKTAGSALLQKAKDVLNKLIESLAVMVVTCFAIPLASAFVFVWLVKNFFGINVKNPNFDAIASTLGKYLNIESAKPKLNAVETNENEE